MNLAEAQDIHFICCMIHISSEKYLACFQIFEKPLLKAHITRWLFWILGRICQQTYKRIFWSFSLLIIITGGQIFTYKLHPLFPHLYYLGYGKKLGLPVCIDTFPLHSALLDVFHTEWSNIYNLIVTSVSSLLQVSIDTVGV